MTQLQLATSDSAIIALDRPTVEMFASSLRGKLIRAGDPDYDSARAVWNGMIDRRPALIARCAGTDDVVRVVKFARTHDLLVAVRGGGHNVAGNAVCDGGLVIDLSPMKEIQIDPARRTVRAQAGLTWGELDRATQECGLATSGGLVSDTGIAGLTLCGGVGWLRNKHGLSCDNLIGVEMVTADGQVRTANANEHLDLFWAVRGGGGNFGVVTWFEYRLHPVGPEVALCFVFYPIAEAWEALRFFDRYAAVAPDEVSLISAIATVPHTEAFPVAIQGERFVLFGGCYIGPVDEGLRVLQPLRAWSTPLIDFSGVTKYVDAQTLWDADYPAGKRRYYWKSIYVNDLRDGVIDSVLSAAAECPSHHSNIDILHMGGAVGRIGATESAFGRRDLPYLIGIEANWDAPDEDAPNIAWARALWADLHRFSSGAVYLNFPGFGEEGDALVRASYGGNYERLAMLKRTYDPANLFRMNQNILPAQ
jgi:FAD/FMN-containing dehydrogenase